MTAPVRLPTGRRAGVVAARVSVLVTSAYLVALGVVLSPGDRSLFGWPELDAQAAFYFVAAVGVVYAIGHRSEPLKWTWVVSLTAVGVGRALTLAVLGSPALLTPGRVLVAVIAWSLVVIGGILAALILTAETILLGPTKTS